MDIARGTSHRHNAFVSRIAPLRGLLIALLFSACAVIDATEFHVSVKGRDSNSGAKSAPLRTVQRAADLARPGDVVTVHGGTYRERVNPPRGGTSGSRRIVYQAAPGERVEIKGSEIARGWVRVQGDVWKVSLPNSLFGSFNPYSDRIHGDWFDTKGREHHTGAVYLNGKWLIEASKLSEVLAPVGTTPAWLTQGDGQYLLNVAWIQPGNDAAPAGRIAAAGFAAQYGVQKAPSSEGGECIGWIEQGDWVRYEGVDFGPGSNQLEIRAASATGGGVIEIRVGSPQGELLGTCSVPGTGGWQEWSSFHAGIRPVSGIKSLCLVFRSRKRENLNAPLQDARLWFAQVEKERTTIWAQFKGVNPNKQLVEVNVRQSVFYPGKPGRNYITVRGFALRQAATPWAPPTAEQIGLIGTHWSKGWIIENNVISHSVCSGISLGKYGDKWDNSSADTAEGYVKTIERALATGWNMESVGHHVVRNNTVSNCEQAGIVGSLGAIHSTITGNTIYDIHVRRLFTGAEMAGIKFHGAIDTTIRGNHIYRTCLGLWLDWMAQGTRVSGNLFHDNASQDLFVEVDHGPFVVDNNLFLSAVSLLDVSEGGAYAHNLIAGKILTSPEPNRETPWHPAHSTAIAGLTTIRGGDDRFFNNIFVRRRGPTSGSGAETAGYGLSMYDSSHFPLLTGGNVYWGARPYGGEAHPLVLQDYRPDIQLFEKGGGTYIRMSYPAPIAKVETAPVTTWLLGRAKIPSLPYENPDGSPLRIGADYLGNPRSPINPAPGPFEKARGGVQVFKVFGPTPNLHSVRSHEPWALATG